MDIVPKVIETRHWLGKFVWLLFFVIFLVATAWIVILCILGYIEYETVSKIEEINERPATFSVITLCNTNPFTSEYAQDLIESFIDKMYGLEKFADYEYSTAIYVMDEAVQLAKMHVAITSYSFKSYANRIQLANHYLFTECRFNQKGCAQNTPLDSLKWGKYSDLWSGIGAMTLETVTSSTRASMYPKCPQRSSK